jgi:chemotaxis protein methyltransferase CheR
MAIELTIPFSTLDQRRSEVELDLLLQGLLQMYEADFQGYDRGYLKKRVAAFLKCHGLASVSALLERVLHDGSAATELCRSLLVSEKNLLESPAQLRALRQAVNSTLSSYAAPKIWIAESTATEDVLAIIGLLVEAGLYHRSTIFATCSSEDVVEKLREGELQREKLPLYEQVWQESGATLPLAELIETTSGITHIEQRLQARVTWSHYNLATDSSFNEFQMIACPVPMSRFRQATGRRVLDLFRESLSHFGILYLSQSVAQEEIALPVNYSAVYSSGMFRRLN